MRTVGEILKKRRLEKNQTIEDVEKNIKIRAKYISALEENDFSKLPSLPYIKGFLRNYANFLGISSDEVLAVFRRQYEYKIDDTLLPKGVVSPLNQPPFRFTPQNIVILASSILVALFLIYLALQYRTYVSPPDLTITAPQEGQVFNIEEVQIKGKTDRDAVIEINNKKIALNESGEFEYKLIMAPGFNTIVIESTSKYGKKKTAIRTVSIQLGQ